MHIDLSSYLTSLHMSADICFDEKPVRKRRSAPPNRLAMFTRGLGYREIHQFDKDGSIGGNAGPKMPSLHALDQKMYGTGTMGD